MAAKKKSQVKAPTARQAMPPVIKNAPASKTKKVRAAAECHDTCAQNAYQTLKTAALPASYNHKITFSIPADRRFVIELVTAHISVPDGETARLRMYTKLLTSGVVSNIDLVVTPQGLSGGRAAFNATHSLRAYADGYLEFNINRDNATTLGTALVCVSGYLL